MSKTALRTASSCLFLLARSTPLQMAVSCLQAGRLRRTSATKSEIMDLLKKVACSDENDCTGININFQLTMPWIERGLTFLMIASRTSGLPAMK